MRGLQHTSCIVTGAARGIGLAIVKRFLSENVEKIYAFDIDHPEEDLGNERIEWYQVDASERDSVKAFFLNFDGKLNYLVNNAAFIDEVDIFNTNFKIWEAMLKNNLSSVWLMTHYCAIHMKNRGGGAIVNIGSVDSFYGHPLRTGYAAAKGGVIGLTNTTAKQLAPYNIRVNCVVPGAVTTRMTPEVRPDNYRPHRLISRNGEPDEIAGAVAFLCSDDASYITGQSLFVDGGAHRF